MARVTVEDCVLKVPNRFELVMVASQRAREISSGAAITIDRDNDKNPVIALREIADTDISIESLKESLIKNHQKVIEIEENDEEIIDMMDGEEEWASVEKEAAEADSHTLGMHEENISIDAEQVGIEAETEAPIPAIEKEDLS